MVSVALQDSIAREIGLTGAASLRRGCGQCTGRRAGHAKKREKRRENKTGEDGVEYVVDQAPPPLTLGGCVRHISHDTCITIDIISHDIMCAHCIMHHLYTVQAGLYSGI